MLGIGAGDFYAGMFALGAMQAENTQAVVGAIEDQTSVLAAGQVRQLEATRYQTQVMQWGFEDLLAGQDAMLAEQQGTNARLDHEIAVLVQTLDTLGQVKGLLENPVATRTAEYLRAAARSLGKGWYEEALGDARHAIELTPTEGVAHFFAAVIYQHQEDSGEALAEFLLAGKYLADGELAQRAFIQAASIHESDGDLNAALDCAHKAVQARSSLNSRYLRARYGLAVNGSSSGYEEELFSVLLQAVSYVPVVAADPLLKPSEAAVNRILERVRDERVRRANATLDSLEAASDSLTKTGVWAESAGVVTTVPTLALRLTDTREMLSGNTIADTVRVDEQTQEATIVIRSSAKSLLESANGWAADAATRIRNANGERTRQEFAAADRKAKLLGFVALGGSPFLVIGAMIVGAVLGYAGLGVLLPNVYGACLGIPAAIAGAVVAMLAATNIIKWVAERQEARDMSGDSLLAKARDKRVNERTDATGEQVRQVEALRDEAQRRVREALAPLNA